MHYPFSTRTDGQKTLAILESERCKAAARQAWTCLRALSRASERCNWEGTRAPIRALEAEIRDAVLHRLGSLNEAVKAIDDALGSPRTSDARAPRDGGNRALHNHRNRAPREGENQAPCHAEDPAPRRARPRHHRPAPATLFTP
jgi:hypothetical protein